MTITTLASKPKKMVVASDVGRGGDQGPLFIDEARILVSAGRGGNGCCSFRREKFVPKGGPDGGCGGKGGHVILEATTQRNTLYDFQRNRQYRAPKGSHGSSKNKRGASGEDLIIGVPLGTVVRDDLGNVLADLVEIGEQVIVARGGRGGRGNRVFATSRRQAPKFAEKGEPGQEQWVKLELRLIAEVGLLGYPNVGKSTLLSRISHAKPKIGAYPFTTLAPKLGVVSCGEKTFTVADLPGIIEGAADGKGLGDRFLRHAERTRLLLHLLDVSAWEGRDPYEDYLHIREELKKHHPALAERPEMIVANKMDVPDAEEKLAVLKDKLSAPIIAISAVVGMGVDELITKVAQELEKLPAFVPREEVFKVHRPDPVYQIVIEKGVYYVRGRRVERLVSMTDLENDEAKLRMEHIIARLGIYRALEEEGCNEGDTVVIGDLEFEYIPDLVAHRW